MSAILSNDYANMTIEVVKTNPIGDLIARTVETHRHIAQAMTGSQGRGDSVDPTFLRLKARACEALANAIEENQ